MDYYSNIKELLVNNEIKKKVKDYSKNKSDLETYYNVGKEIVEAQGGEARAKYGNRLIEDYSKRLTSELGKGYSITNLKYMRTFYLYIQKGQHIADQLSWSHYQVLLSLDNIDEINYYLNKCIKNNLGRNGLRTIIKNKEYERLPKATIEKIANKEELVLLDEVKDTIVINNKLNIEKVLKEIILDDIEILLKE